MKIDPNFLKKKRNSCYKGTHDVILKNLVSLPELQLDQLLKEKKALTSCDNNPQLIAKILDFLDLTIETIIQDFKNFLRGLSPIETIKQKKEELNNILEIYSFILEAKVNKQIFSSKEHIIDLLPLVDCPKLLVKLLNVLISIFSEEPNMDSISVKIPKLTLCLKIAMNVANIGRFGESMTLSSYLYDIKGGKELKYYVEPIDIMEISKINCPPEFLSQDSQIKEAKEINLINCLNENKIPLENSQEILKNNGFNIDSPLLLCLISHRINLLKKFNEIENRIDYIILSMRAAVLYNMIFVSDEKISTILTKNFGVTPDFPIFLSEIIEFLNIPAPKELHIQVVKCLADLVLVEHSDTKDFLTEIEENNSKFESILMLISKIRLLNYQKIIEYPKDFSISTPLETIISEKFILEFLGLIKKAVKSLFIDDEGNPEAGALFLLIRLSQSLLSILDNPIYNDNSVPSETKYIKPFSSEVYVSVCEILLLLFTNHYLSTELDFMGNLIRCTEKELELLAKSNEIYEPYTLNGTEEYRKIPDDSLFEFLAELLNIIDSPFYRRVPARAQLVPTMARKISESRILSMVQTFFFQKVKITEKLFVYTMILAGDICREIPAIVDDLISKHLFHSILKRLFEIEYPSDSESYPMIAYLINMLGLTENGRELELEFNAIGRFFEIFLDESQADLLFGEYPYPQLKTVSSLAHEFYEMSTTVEMLKDRLLEEVRRVFEIFLAKQSYFFKCLMNWFSDNMFSWKTLEREFEILKKQTISIMKFFSKLFTPYSALSEKFNENGSIEYFMRLCCFPTVNTIDYYSKSPVLLNCVKAVACEGKYSQLGLSKQSENLFFDFYRTMELKYPEYKTLDFIFEFDQNEILNEDFGNLNFISKAIGKGNYKGLDLQNYGLSFYYLAQFVNYDSKPLEQGIKTVHLFNALLSGLRMTIGQFCLSNNRNIESLESLIVTMKKYVKLLLHGIGNNWFDQFICSIPFIVKLFKPPKFDYYSSSIFSKTFFSSCNGVLNLMAKNPILMIHMNNCGFYEILFDHINTIFKFQLDENCDSIDVANLLKDVKISASTLNSICKQVIGLHLNSPIHQDIIRAINYKVLKLANTVLNNLKSDQKLEGLPEALCSSINKIIIHEEKSRKEPQQSNYSKILKNMGFSTEVIEKAVKFKNPTSLTNLFDIISSHSYEPLPQGENEVESYSHIVNSSNKLTIQEFNSSMVDISYLLGETMFKKMLYFQIKGRNDLKKFIISVLEKLTAESKKALSNAMLYTTIGSIKYLVEEIFYEEKFKLKIFVKAKKQIQGKIDFKTAFCGIHKDKINSLKEIIALLISFYEFIEQFENNSIKGNIFNEFLRLGNKILNFPLDKTRITIISYILFLCQRYLNKFKTTENSKALVKFISSIFTRLIGSEELLVKNVFNTSTKLIVMIFKKFPETIEYFVVELKGLKVYLALNLKISDSAFPSFVDCLLQGENICEIALKSEISKFFIEKSNSGKEIKRFKPKGGKRSKPMDSNIEIENEEIKLESRKIEDFVRHFSYFSNSKAFLDTVKEICSLDEELISLKIKPEEFRVPRVTGKILSFLINLLEKNVIESECDKMEIEEQEKVDKEVSRNDRKENISPSKAPVLKIRTSTKEIIFKAFFFILSQHPELFSSFSKLKSRQGNYLYQLPIKCVSKGDVSPFSCIDLIRKLFKDSLVNDVLETFFIYLSKADQNSFYNISSLLTSTLDITSVASNICNNFRKRFIESYTEKLIEFKLIDKSIYSENLFKVTNPLSIIMQYLVYFSKKREDLPKIMPKDVLYNAESIMENWNTIMGFSRNSQELDNIDIFIDDDEDDGIEDFNDSLNWASNDDEDNNDVFYISESDENGDDHSNEDSNSQDEENISSSSDNEDVVIEEFDSDNESLENQENSDINIEATITDNSDDHISLISSTLPINIDLTVDNFGNSNNSRRSEVYNRMVEDVVSNNIESSSLYQIDEFPEADPMEVLDDSENSLEMLKEVSRNEGYNEEDFKQRLINHMTDKSEIEEKESSELKSQIEIEAEAEAEQPLQNPEQTEQISQALRETLESLGLDESFLQENSIDISYLNSLPQEFQNEILGEMIDQVDEDEPLEEFMNALDPRMRRQIENQSQITIRNNQPLTNSTFIQALPESIRREIIQSASEEFLDSLPDSLISQYGRRSNLANENIGDVVIRSDLIPSSDELMEWIFDFMFTSNTYFIRFPFGLLKALLKNDHNYNYFMNKGLSLLVKYLGNERMNNMGNHEIIYEKDSVIGNYDVVRNLVSIKILTLLETICKDDLSFFYQDNCKPLNVFLSLLNKEFTRKNTGHYIVILSIANLILKDSERILNLRIDSENITFILDTINIISGPRDPILMELSSLISRIMIKGELFDTIHNNLLSYASFLAKVLSVEIKCHNYFEKATDRFFCIIFKILTLVYQEKKELRFKLNDFLEKENLNILWETSKEILSSYQNKESIIDRFVQRFIGILENFFILHKLISQRDSAKEIDNSLKINFSPERKHSNSTDLHPIFFEICEQNQGIINMMVKHNMNILSDTLSVVVEKMPRILTFENKRSYFKSEIRKMKNNEGSSPFRIKIRRSEVFLDSFHYMRAMTPSELKGRMSVEFQGEEAVDEGGVTREWFLLLSREIFNPNYALFKPSANGVTFIPSENSHINSEEHLSYFKFIGRIIAKALHDGYLLDCFFSQFFYKHILGQQLSVRDLEDVDPEFYKNLRWILDNNVEGLDFTFSYERNEFGNIVICDLIENGREVLVNEGNKSEYVLKLCEAKMIKDIEKQIQSFLEGFYDIIPKNLIRIFDFRELELMISGLPDIDSFFSIISVQDLKENTEYTNYNVKSQNIIWMWEILEEFGKEDRASFIQFVTGTSKVPLEGFKALSGANGPQKFQVHKCFDSTKLPSAHTCFNQLDLPDYGDREILKKKFILAIQEGKEGFGFA